MTWARLDDRANEHRKQLAAGHEACWLWSCGLMYANRQPQRDGFIPEAMVAMLYPFKSPQRLVAKLLEVGLWEKAPGGYQIHDYLFWNKTKDQVNHEKAEARRRAAESYARKKAESALISAQLSAPAESTQNPDSAGVVVASGLVSGSDPRATTDQVDSARELAAQAQRVLKNPFDGEYLQPSKWPAVVAVAEAWSFGMPCRLGNSPRSDSDLRTILEAIAAGNPIEDLVRAGELAQTDDYFAKRPKKGPASFTAAVIRRLLAAPSGVMRVVDEYSHPPGESPLERAERAAFGGPRS